MAKIAHVAAVFFTFIALSFQTQAEEAAKIIRRAKEATALLTAGNGSRGTAFCIESSGMFVTHWEILHKVGMTVTLVLNAGEPDQKLVKATVVRSEMKARLTLLKAEGDDFPFLQLGDNDVYETMPVTFLHHSGNVPRDENGNHKPYPTVGVIADRISGLRKKEGQIQFLQIEKRLASGNSGGPVIDDSGRVIGILHATVPGTTPKLAIPVAELKKLLDEPVIVFTTTSLDESESHESRRFPVKIISFRKPSANRKVELEFQSGTAELRRFKAQGDKNGAYEVTAVLVPEQPGPMPLRIDAEFAEGSVNCRVADQDVKVGDESVRLSKIQRVEPGPTGEQPKVILDGKVLRGAIVGLEQARVNLGGVETKLDLTKAIRMKVEPISRLPGEVNYRVVVHEGRKIVSEAKGSIAINVPRQEGTSPVNSSPQKDVVVTAPPVNIPKLTPPDLAEGNTIIPIPAPIDDVVVGAAGRFLILHLKKLQQLAVFDVSQARVVKYLPLASNDIAYAAGAQKLFIVLRESQLIQRWDLNTLEREIVMAAPEGGIKSMTIGAEAISPLIVLLSANDKRSSLIDTTTMKAEPFAWKGWSGGAWGPVHVHASFDGSAAVACGGGWAGIELVTLADGRVISSQVGSSVYGDTLIAGNGALVFPEKIGILRADLASTVKGIEGTPFPADDPRFSLAFLVRDKKPTLTLFSNGDPKLIATIRDLPELGKNSKLALSQRIHLIPRANVLVTVGENDDRLVLRQFDLVQALDDEGTDYFFLESTPVRTTDRGTQYRYAIQVRSRKGNVQFSLQAAPEGMTISKEGVLTWNVPRDYEGKEATVIVQVSDDSHQETFHSFKLSIADQPRAANVTEDLQPKKPQPEK